MYGRRPLMTVLHIVGLTILGLLTFGVLSLIFGFFVLLLWNWLIPDIFHLSQINFWQAFGIVILGKLIFGTCGPNGPFHGHRFRRHIPHPPYCNSWNGEEWQIKGGWKIWSYYEDWWRKEGKTAFENYIDRTSATGNHETNNDAP